MKRPSSDFEASIRIIPVDEGGRKTPAHNGIRWDFCYKNDTPADNLWMIWPIFLDENHLPLPDKFPLSIGENIQAEMTIVNDEIRKSIHRTRINVGTEFFCCEGPKVVATGIVTKITGLHIERTENQNNGT